jgi:hypothetical protein
LEFSDWLSATFLNRKVVVKGQEVVEPTDTPSLSFTTVEETLDKAEAALSFNKLINWMRYLAHPAQ